MKDLVRFAGSVILLAAILFGLGTRMSLGKTNIPPLGPFLSPATGFTQNMKSRISGVPLSCQTPSGNPARVVFDDRLVPHIFAESTMDACYVQGYVTAMQRLWQMDMGTRAAAGRLSEVFGERTLEYDQERRQRGLHEAAKRADVKWKESRKTYAHLEAYSDGINDYVNTLDPGDLPLEYKLMDFRPESWSPYHSALFTKSMVDKLCSQQKDVEHSTAYNWLGRDLFAEIFPMANPYADPVISPGNTWDFNPVAVPGDTIPYFDIGASGASVPADDFQLGSNNWAVSGKKTESGVPILCNDPHLQLSLPSVWFECHIITPDYNCYGVTLPGMPGIVIGFNEHIAWGTTNAGHDVMDWYKVDWVDEGKEQYWLDGKKTDVAYHEECYHVRGGKMVRDTIRYTVWGPVSEDGIHAGMAMKWMGMEAPSESEPATFLLLNSARNMQDYLSATDHFVTPAQNFIFASTEGDIAIRVSGTLPLRKPGQGVFVQDGSLTSNNWPGMIPGSQNPLEINPERQFISSANQVSTDLSYPYFYHGEPYFEDYRGRWLNRQLAQMNDITIKDMMGLQQDTRSLKAMEILPTFLGAMQGKNDLTSQEKEILSLLANWNYSYEWNQAAPVYFDAWYREFYAQTWDEFYRVSDSIPVAWPQDWRTIDLAVNNPGHEFFDHRKTEGIEHAGDIIARSFRKMISKVADTGKESSVTWGEERTTTIRHLAGIPAFSRKLTEVSGHGDALNATTRSSGPSWRMIVEMSSPPRAWVVYPGGQAGTPGSPHYAELVNEWAKGQYVEANFVSHPDQLSAVASHEIRFE